MNHFWLLRLSEIYLTADRYYMQTVKLHLHSSNGELSNTKLHLRNLVKTTRTCAKSRRTVQFTGTREESNMWETCPNIETRWRREVPHASGLALAPSQPAKPQLKRQTWGTQNTNLINFKLHWWDISIDSGRPWYKTLREDCSNDTWYRTLRRSL